MRKQSRSLVAGVVALGLVVTACGGDDDEASTDQSVEEPSDESADEPADEPSDEPADEPSDEPADEPSDDAAMPGEGVSVVQARANWSSGYAAAAIYHLMMEELGYEVSDPAELELGPSAFYTALAQGEIDFWQESWYPSHRSFFANELPDGSTAGDHVTVVGEETMAGGLQGYLISKTFADEYGITHLDQLNDDPEILAAFDEFDANPGDGIAQIYGCEEAFTCDDVIQSQIAFSGWDNIEQNIAGYDAMFASAVGQVEAGEPVVIYTWTPSSYVTQLIPGANVYWLAVEDVIDDSNPLGVEGGEEHSQLPGTATIGPDQCPAAADHPDGLCEMGWVAADIQVTANNEFLAANPAAEALFDVVQLDVIEVSDLTLRVDAGEDPMDIAAQWIEDNRDTVDGWLETARAAG
ncbi:MAG: glycine betaine/L-proline ABC transporter substrate-binding protein ProX [Ilumatobacter sp.]|nr:glycine betaine/L-proline ABC transporter substrate-binding protein ProX [Ilumatobacter sp.]